MCTKSIALLIVGMKLRKIENNYGTGKEFPTCNSFTNGTQKLERYSMQKHWRGGGGGMGAWRKVGVSEVW